jgi:hypothetical protein
MPTQFLKTHYRRGASVLTPEQIEEIRCLKNKVPAYMIVRDYHINKDRVYDIWDNTERLQQSGEYLLADMLPCKAPNGKASNPSETVHSDIKKKKTGGSGSLGDRTKPKEKSRSKSVRISEPPVTQMAPLEPIQPISVDLESSDINKEKLRASYEEMVERSIKILDEKKKRYPSFGQDLQEIV